MPDLLFFGDTERSPAMRHELIAIEPGLTVAGIGEVRLEDLLLVTQDGSATLTRYPYDLTP